MHFTVPVVRFDDRFGKMTFFDIDMRQFRSEGRVATMIGPVRIQDAQFGQRRIAIHLIAKIFLHDRQIRFIHGQTVLRKHR